ncbi:helix-turn-helix domain-containing protein [Peijinzhouia sedimentorum]
MPIIINLDVAMAKKKMSLTELSEKVGISMTNLSLIKKGKVKGIRFNTLESICKTLECKPGDILDFEE